MYTPLNQRKCNDLQALHAGSLPSKPTRAETDGTRAGFHQIQLATTELKPWGDTPPGDMGRWGQRTHRSNAQIGLRSNSQSGSGENVLPSHRKWAPVPYSRENHMPAGAPCTHSPRKHSWNGQGSGPCLGGTPWYAEKQLVQWPNWTWDDRIIHILLVSTCKPADHSKQA